MELVKNMRLRNVKNKQQIMNCSNYLVQDPILYRGKWNLIFEKSQPIHIEIGMGKGNFIIENALRYPNINFIGIEKYDSVIARALEKVPEDLPNLMMIRMDAMLIEDVFSKEVDTIYLNFSDPWPKKKHQNRRLTSPLFLKKYDSIFVGRKQIIQKTDNSSLFEYSLTSFSQYGYVIEQLSFDYHHSHECDIVMTEYEKKFSEKGQNIYRVVVKKDV